MPRTAKKESPPVRLEPVPHVAAHDAIEPELHMDIEAEFRKPVHDVPYFRVYAKDGTAVDVMYSVDAREMVESGEYTMEPPVQPATSGPAVE